MSKAPNKYETCATCGELTRDEVTELRISGIAVGEIARICNVSRATLYCALSAWDLTGPIGGDHRSESFRRRCCKVIGGVR